MSRKWEVPVGLAPTVVDEPGEDRLAAFERARAMLSDVDLTPKQREVAEMHYLQDMGVRQIARELGVSAPAITQRLDRVRLRLRRRYKN